MEKRAVVAILLSTLIVILYPFFLAKFFPSLVPSQEQQQKEVVAASVEELETRASAKPVDLPLPKNDITYEYVGTYSQITSDLFTVDIQQSDGAIGAIWVRDVPDPQTGEASRLVNSGQASPPLFSMDLSVNGRQVGLSPAPEQGMQTRGNTFSGKYITDSDIKVYKKITASDDAHLLSATVEFHNTGTTAQKIKYTITGCSNLSTAPAKGRRFDEVKAMANNELFRKRMFGRGIKTIELENPVAWVAVQDKYFSLIARPGQSADRGFFRMGQNIMEAYVGSQDITLVPGERLVRAYEFFVGPTDPDELGALGLSDAAYFGKFTKPSQWVIKILRKIYGLTHNYGVALILLASLVNIILYPLTTKRSLDSARKMQAIQPHLAKLREKHKNDPQRLNKEMMELYKEHKINPLGGCLPMLLQMPIFFALFTGLMRSIELRGANFLWIKDLSLPDNAFTLPFSLPVIGNSVNILPLFMCGAMFLQQRMSMASQSSSMDKQQKQMMIMMPIIFGFIFYNFASGLVLYWLTGTLWMVGLQSMFHRKPAA